MSKESLRSLTIGRKPQFKTELVEIEGSFFEVRAPSLRQRDEIMKLIGVKPGDKDAESKINPSEMQASLLVFMIFVPGTDEHVFELADKAELVDQPTGGWVDTLAKVCMKMLNMVGDGEVPLGKNSVPTLVDDSTTK